MSAYTLAFGSLLLLGGRIADYLGRRRMFIIGLLGFGAASALGGLAQDSAMLFGARALQGAFAAVMAPAALSLLTVTFTEARERARAFGVYGAIAGGGAAIGLVSRRHLDPARLVALDTADQRADRAPCGRRCEPVHPREPCRIAAQLRPSGAVTVTGGLFLLVYGFTTAGTDGWGAPLTLTLLVGAVVALVAFVVIELRSPHPLLPVRVVLDRNRGGSFLASLFVGSAMLGTFLFLTYFLQGTLGYSALKTGFAFLPFSGGIIIGAGLASRLLPRIGPRVLIVTGVLLAAAGLFWFTGLTVDSTYVAHVLPPEILVSVGMGLAFVPLSSTALVGVQEEHAGVASALVNTTQQIGGALGTALLNTIAATATAGYLTHHGHATAATRGAAVHGYTTAFTVSAALLVAAGVVAGTLIRSARHHTQPELD